MTETRKFLGRRIESVIEVTELEENKTFNVKVVSGPIPFSVQTSFEAIDGGTRVTALAEGDPGGFFKLAEPLIARQSERQLGHDLETLKDLLEAQA